jgi:Fur family transcriptional regulator, ferric uptake regulator
MPQPRGTRVRSTRQAAAVIDVMSKMSAFCGARDIYDALREAGYWVGLATVYRHLHVLAEHGEVDTIHVGRGETRYRLRTASTTCHLTCRACGESVEVDASEVRDWAASLAAQAGFTLTGYTAHLTGLCTGSCDGRPGDLRRPSVPSEVGLSPEADPALALSGGRTGRRPSPM